jgi:Leucine-rich repeat (LRR) protein
VIKGKEAASYRSEYIKDILEEISRIDNMCIELDYARYNPYYISEKADLTIACHTSLCDELLAAGRKVIIYEISDLLSTLFNYENLPIIVNNYSELKNNVDKCLKNVYLSEETINAIKERFYSNCYHGQIQRNIQSFLETAYKHA